MGRSTPPPTSAVRPKIAEFGEIDAISRVRRMQHGQAQAPNCSHIAPVRTREELIYLLSRACELEHGVACVYLFAAYSLKSHPDEGGINAAQAETVKRWKRRLVAVSVEEMLHLTQLTNIITAIGGAAALLRTA